MSVANSDASFRQARYSLDDLTETDGRIVDRQFFGYANLEIAFEQHAPRRIQQAAVLENTAGQAHRIDPMMIPAQPGHIADHPGETEMKATGAPRG